MSSRLSTTKRFWAKDCGNRGVEIHDLSKPYDRKVQSHPKMDNRAIAELLNNFDPTN